MSGMKSFATLSIGFALFVCLTGLSGWITLMIITTGGDIVIPDVIGEDLKTGIGRLQASRLYLVLDGEEFHGEAPRGVIIAQNPVPGESRKAYSSVRVILSAGPERVEMPDLRGFGLRQAQQEITRFDTGPCREYYIYHTDYAEGEVIAHIPGPHEIIVPGAEISVMVSQGNQPVPYRMPDIIGLTIDETRGWMDPFQSRFELTISNRREFGPGIVIDQHPAPGNPVKIGDPIRLTVTAEETGASNVPSVFTWHAPPGFLNKSLIITYTINGNSEVLMEREVAPAEEIVLHVPNTGRGVLEITLDGESIFSEVR
ncbi:PASTA domain-containing protein [bacterium]|nr:PASTA domain-containing protein [candidate division CSSED10-310 bacterium]